MTHTLHNRLKTRFFTTRSFFLQTSLNSLGVWIVYTLLVTHTVILLLMQGQEETSFSILLSSFLQLLWLCSTFACWPQETLWLKWRIPFQARFNVINPVFCASLSPSFPSSTWRSLSIPVHICLSLPRLEIDRLELTEKGTLWGQTLKHQSARLSALMKS